MNCDTTTTTTTTTTKKKVFISQGHNMLTYNITSVLHLFFMENSKSEVGHNFEDIQDITLRTYKIGHTNKTIQNRGKIFTVFTGSPINTQRLKVDKSDLEKEKTETQIFYIFYNQSRKQEQKCRNDTLFSELVESIKKRISEISTFSTQSNQYPAKQWPVKLAYLEDKYFKFFKSILSRHGYHGHTWHHKKRGKNILSFLSQSKGEIAKHRQNTVISTSEHSGKLGLKKHQFHQSFLSRRPSRFSVFSVNLIEKRIS